MRAEMLVVVGWVGGETNARERRRKKKKKEQPQIERRALLFFFSGPLREAR
jgi:hypothetical protein